MSRQQIDRFPESPRDLFRAYQYGRVITLVATFLVLLLVQLFAGVNEQIAYVYLLLMFDLGMTFAYFSLAQRGMWDLRTLSMIGVLVDTLCMVVGIYLVGAEAERYGLIIFGFLVVMAAAVHSSSAAILVGLASSALYALLIWAVHAEFVTWRPQPIPYDLETEWPLMPGLANGAGVMALAFISGWLADSWRAAQASADELNRELETRVNQRTLELTQRNTSLEQSEENIRLYARAVSHDLRSPVTIALENAKLAQTEDPAQRDEFLAETIAALRRGDAMLAGLVGVMRDGAKVESDTPVEFGAVVIELVAAEFRDHDSVVVSGVFPRVFVRREALQHIVRNLVTNAIAHNPDDQELVVRVSATARRSGSLFCVSDNGVGIAPERINRVFEPFVRGPDVKSQGLGLGLYSLKRMISRVGGKIWAESGDGQGTSVFFTLPEAPLENEHGL